MIKITHNYLMKQFISFDEMGAFDLPAALTYVRSKGPSIYDVCSALLLLD